MWFHGPIQIHMDEPVIYLELLPDDEDYVMENHVQVPLLNDQGMFSCLFNSFYGDQLLFDVLWDLTKNQSIKMWFCIKI